MPAPSETAPAALSLEPGAAGDAPVRPPPIPAEVIRTAVTLPGGNRAWSTLSAYARLQGGRAWEWLAIWALQNIRYCPVYILPLLTGHLIDRIDPQDPGRALGQLPWVLAATAGLCVATVACETGARAMLSRISRLLTASLRTALLHRINRLEFSFHDRAQLGALQSKFTLDMGRLEGFQTFLAEPVLMYGTVMIVMLAIIASTNILLLFVIVAAVPVHLLLVRLFWNRISALNDAYRGAETGFMASLHEALNGLRTVRAHAAERFVEDRIARAAGDVAKKAMRLDLMTNLFGSGSWAVSTLLHMGVVALGVWLAAGAEHRFSLFGREWTVEAITIGEFTILMSYYAIIAGAIGAVLGGLPAVAAADDAIRSLAQLFAEDAGPRRLRRKLRKVDRLRGDIRLEGVHFRYQDADRHCLAGLDLNIAAGTSLALVGPSGSGKSTIASLILGFYPPDAGRVLIDGRDLAELDRRSLRRHVGVVSQDVVLFQDSILANIAWGDRRPDVGRARDAARRAHALGFIDGLPGGMLHVLGDRGLGLSGGQRQRLAIARAIYRDPRLLILDEATSALDPESERLVQEALDELRRDRTTIIIAHRLSTVRKADSIAVIDRGAVAERGSFAELMARDGPFRRLAEGSLAGAGG